MNERKVEGLQRKIDNINKLANILSFYEERIKKDMDFLEMLDNFNCHNIQIEGTDNEGEYKHNLFVPLWCAGMDEVIEFIKEKIKSQIRERDDEIKAKSEELDKLLK